MPKSSRGQRPLSRGKDKREGTAQLTGSKQK